jgi:hypothetical protein
MFSANRKGHPWITNLRVRTFRWRASDVLIPDLRIDLPFLRRERAGRGIRAACAYVFLPFTAADHVHNVGEVDSTRRAQRAKSTLSNAQPRIAARPFGHDTVGSQRLRGTRPRKIAKSLLGKLKSEKFVLDWRKWQKARPSVRLTIEQMLEGLPKSKSERRLQRQM